MTTKTLEEMSVSEIEQELRNRLSKVKSLEKRREKLRAEVDALDEQIAELTGNESGGSRRRAKNEKSLYQYVTDILGRYKKGLGLQALTDKVLEEGYNTNSSNFKNTVYQCVYNADDISRDEKSGNYVIE